MGIKIAETCYCLIIRSSEWESLCGKLQSLLEGSSWKLALFHPEAVTQGDHKVFLEE